MYTKAALPPMNIVECDSNDLARSEPVCSDEEQHGVVAKSDCRGRVDGLQKRVHLIPWESAGQLLEPIKPRSIDLAIQSNGNPAVNSEKAQEPTHSSDIVLQA